MGRGVVAVLAVLLLLAGTGCGKATTETVAVGEKSGVGAPSDLVQFGYVKAMTSHGATYRIRFDPALMLSGETASVAAAEDGAVEPGQPVPNDYYRVNEGSRLYTYIVPKDARVTVLRDGVEGMEIGVDELAQLVNGEDPFGEALFEPITTGFWMRAHIDTVRSLDQQYLP
jgi:hypothetical protein